MDAQVTLFELAAVAGAAARVFFGNEKLVTDDFAQRQLQRRRQPEATLGIKQPKDLLPGQAREELADVAERKGSRARAKRTEQRTHRRTRDQRRHDARFVEDREGADVDVAGAAAAAHHEGEGPSARGAIESRRGQPVAEQSQQFEALDTRSVAWPMSTTSAVPSSGRTCTALIRESDNAQRRALSSWGASHDGSATTALSRSTSRRCSSRAQGRRWGDNRSSLKHQT